MAKIAVMGFGTVGSGVVEVISTNHESIAKKAKEPIDVKYILVRREKESTDVYKRQVPPGAASSAGWPFPFTHSSS